MEFHVRGGANMQEVAKEVLRAVKAAPEPGAAVLALYGDLGAGKTTFVKALADRLGVAEEVTSPTYLITRTYDTEDDIFETLVHIDAYRLEDPRELTHLDWGDMLARPRSLICVEWAGKVETILPRRVKRLRFEHIAQDERVVRFE